MKALVLLSAGRHAATANPAPAVTELAAIRLARELGAQPTGLHAGPDAGPVRPAFGHGLAHLRHLPMPADADVTRALAAEVARQAPDLVLAGHRAPGGAQTGLLPYCLAQELGWPIVADAAALGCEDGIFHIDQVLPKGLRRRLHHGGPLIVTVHPTAPPPLPFAFGPARRGQVETAEPPMASDIAPATMPELRPHRPRARIMRGATTGGSAAERLKAATQSTSAGTGTLLVDPDPETAARTILAHLRAIGVLVG